MNLSTFQSAALFTLAFLWALPGYSQVKRASNAQFIAELDKKVPAYLEEFIVPGAAIAIIQNGKVILQKGYGIANVEKQLKVTDRTGFNIASISKTISAWGVMKLVEQGKLELDAPADTYLTRWHLPGSEFDANGVTIRRLLSHTAGLSLHGYPGWATTDTLPTIEESLSGKTNGAGEVKLIMEPGTRWKYSGGGYTMLQLIIEGVTGKSFAAYMRSAILDPLGMTNSGFDINETIMNASSLEHNSYGEVIPFELFTAQAAAGFHTTIEDLAKFALASLKVTGKQSSVLQASTIDSMMTAAPASDGRYGLGYSIEEIGGSKTVLVGHGGANDGWHSILQLDPRTRDGFIMITNGETGHAVYMQACADWLQWNYGINEERMRRKPIIPLMVRKYKEGGIDATVSAYQEAKATAPKAYNFNEADVNLFAYQLMWDDKLDDALAIFKLNVEENPYAFNPFDSYGEALLVKGDTAGAIKNYTRSMDLNPLNDNGRAVLEKLGVHVPPYVEPISILDAPDGWASEIIPFPINFAPTIDLKGFEELSFAPNWRDSTSQNLWTLMYVWYVEPSGDLTDEQLAHYLEAYYDGLMDVEYATDHGAEKTRCTIKNTPEGKRAEIRVFDNFVKKKMMLLNMKIEQGHCAETDKQLIQFRISPKRFDDQIWDKFDAVRVKVKCG
ncbi:MAG: serine hydrolase [Flavobacteriales bacterium]